MSALAAAGKQWSEGVTLISVDRQRDEGTKHEVLLQQVSSAHPDRGDDREKSIFLTFQVSCLSGSYRKSHGGTIVFQRFQACAVPEAMVTAD
jgi:hypothetical protein